MTKMLTLSLAAVLCSTTTGCMFDYLDRLADRDASYDVYEPYDYSGDLGTEVTIDNGYMAGDLGSYEAFVAPSYETSGNTYGDNTAVELHGGEDYWVMTRLEVQGSLQHRDLAPGAHLEFDSSTYGWDSDPYADTQPLYISSVGCSGPTHGNWDYDSGAERVVVDVEQGATPNDRILHFEAEYVYEGETQVVDGSFGYTVY